MQTYGTRVCHQCKVSSSALMRCSRCRTVWYCTPGCQKQDWDSHRPNCVVPTPEQVREIDQRCHAEYRDLATGLTDWQARRNLAQDNQAAVSPPKFDLSKYKDGEDDEIMQQSVVTLSLRDPLVCDRIKIPVRGRECHHLPAYDLEVCTEFSHLSPQTDFPVY